MEGKAFSWQQQYLHMAGRLDIPWKKLMEDMACRFDTGIYDDPLVKLVNMKQYVSLDDYMNEFDDLVCRTRLDEKQTLSCFLGGLEGPLEKAVRIQNPKSLKEARKLARLQDNLLLEIAHSAHVNNQTFKKLTS